MGKQRLTGAARRLAAANRAVQQAAGAEDPGAGLHAYGLTRAQRALFQRTVAKPIALPRGGGGRWFAIWVAPGAEFLTLNQLYRRKVPAFLPKQVGQRKISRTNPAAQMVARPVITQLVFLWAPSVGEAVAILRRIELVRGVFTPDGVRLQGINGADFWAFLERHGWGDDLGPGPNYEFAEGDRVRVQDGAFAEHEVIFAGATDGLATVLAELFGGVRPVVVALSALRPMG